MTLSAVVLLLSSDAYEFSWRYQLPAVVMLPVAGALGLTALAAGPDQPGQGQHGKPSLLFRPPPPVQVDELVPHLRRQVLGRQPTGEADGLAHLRQVLGAVRAAGQVRLEAAPGRRG